MALKSFPKISILVVIVPLLLLSHNLYAASAASGGRMGGSSFSSEKSPSSSRRDDDHHNHHYHHHHHHYHHSSRVSQPSFSRNANEENGSMSAAVVFLIVFIFLGVALCFVYVEDRISVLGVQVALSAKARSLQRDLTEIALTTDTSTAKGWNFILEETTSSLLHHPNCYLYGYSSVTQYWTLGGAEQHFKRLSKEERLKFDVESLVNINNIKRQRAVVQKADKVHKDRIVVTVLVAAQGAHNLPTIRTSNNVKEALQSLAEISSSKLKAVEVLWSPQDETDSLSDEDLLENYPQLRQLW
ncbi:hypothetical protein REPUB_Repub15cG0067500 [Reevesia pubescens]